MRTASSLYFKIVMVVKLTSTVERGVAVGTLYMVHIALNRHFMLANTTKNSFRMIKAVRWPLFSWMCFCFVMAMDTGIVFVATLELDSDDIKFSVVMHTPCFVVDSCAINVYHLTYPSVDVSSSDSPIIRTSRSRLTSNFSLTTCWTCLMRFS
ncbi:Uncharacterised protein [Staphylococcus muscae]|uniref:Uncharacterized protein n=1 Tax=Staphylococcus muscae TaxID=1294 RepID=A0A240BWL2_9STAP|nr:Uncharacterised protein [Staphylococcus muscae]